MTRAIAEGDDRATARAGGMADAGAVPDQSPRVTPRSGRQPLALFLGAPRTRADQFDALDGLRALAVLIVIASHMALVGLVPGRLFAGAGKSGVYLFFVLSAFLLTRALLARPLASLADGRLWAQYAVRRVLRIWPLYLVVLATSWLLTSAAVRWPYRIDTPSLLRHLGLQEGQSVLWSIPVEFTFYLWLPLAALALAWMQARRWPWWGEALAVLAALAAATVLWPPGDTAANDIRLGPYLVIFLCGAYAARLDLRLRQQAPRPWLWGTLAGLALAFFLFSVPQVRAWLSGLPLDRKAAHHWFLAFGLAWSMLLLGVLHGPVGLRRLFASAPMRLVGVVSFSLYLWHIPVLDSLRRAGLDQAGWPTLAILAAMLAAAMLSFLLFERPWRDLRPWARRDRPGGRVYAGAGGGR